jgi:hypothetical protein
MRHFVLISFSILFVALANCQDSTNAKIRKVTIKKGFTESDLFPRLCGKLIGDISFKEIETDPVLKTKAKLKIDSFKMSLRVGSGVLVYSSDSQRLTSLMLEVIANLKSGEPILFYDIKTFHYSGKLIQLQPLELIYR